MCIRALDLYINLRVFSHLVRLSPANALRAVQFVYVNQQVISDLPKRTQKRTVLSEFSSFVGPFVVRFPRDL